MFFMKFKKKAVFQQIGVTIIHHSSKKRQVAKNILTDIPKHLKKLCNICTMSIMPFLFLSVSLFQVHSQCEQKCIKIV